MLALRATASAGVQPYGKNDFGGFRNVLPPEFRAIGAITQPLIEWVNRPTFQQADEILGHGPR